MKAIGYIRVSTVEQADEGVSLDAQTAKIEAYCSLSDHELDGMYVDAGISGRKMANRPGLKKAIDKACEEKAVVVVYSLSRLTRSIRDAIDLAERLDKAGADLVSISEKIDTTTASGKMVFRMMAVLAEFESDQISERTKLAMAHLKSEGKYTGGRATYGYEPGVDGVLVEVPEEQETIRMARGFLAKGYNHNQIASRLNMHGRRNRKNGVFQCVQVTKMLERTA